MPGPKAPLPVPWMSYVPIYAPYKDEMVEWYQELLEQFPELDYTEDRNSAAWFFRLHGRTLLDDNCDPLFNCDLDQYGNYLASRTQSRVRRVFAAVDMLRRFHAAYLDGADIRTSIVGGLGLEWRDARGKLMDCGLMGNLQAVLEEFKERTNMDSPLREFWRERELEAMTRVYADLVAMAPPTTVRTLNPTSAPFVPAAGPSNSSSARQTRASPAAANNPEVGVVNFFSTRQVQTSPATAGTGPVDSSLFERAKPSPTTVTIPGAECCDPNGCACEDDESWTDDESFYPPRRSSAPRYRSLSSHPRSHCKLQKSRRGSKMTDAKPLESSSKPTEPSSSSFPSPSNPWDSALVRNLWNSPLPSVNVLQPANILRPGNTFRTCLPDHIIAACRDVADATAAERIGCLFDGEPYGLERAEAIDAVVRVVVPTR